MVEIIVEIALGIVLGTVIIGRRVLCISYCH